MPASDWLVPFRPRGDDAIRVFCLPYAGGGTVGYRDLAHSLPADIETVGVRPPGREARFGERPYRAVTELVADLGAVIGPWLSRPYVLFGHSLGALIAFELARELRRRDLPPARALLVSGRAAPQLPWRWRRLATLPDDEFLRAVTDLNGTPSELLASDELMTLFMPLLRADFAMNEGYAWREERALDIPIHAFGGARDPTVTMAELRAWSAQTSADFQLTMVDGDHFFVHARHAELVRELVRAVRSLGPAA